ncbi:NUPL2 family protein [Megaselia abdita]
MPICKFFLTGSCRFGSKCNNDHIDLKQVITTEVQATLKGNQWPLSCFGPFKEKKNIPNFIEDVSFEEARFNAYEAGKQNAFQNYSQQFNQQLQDAQNKMNAMLTLNKEIVDVIIAIYDDEPSGQKQGNSFSIGGSAFGASTPSANSVFGGATSAPSTGGSIFGGGFGANNSTATQGSVFGGTALKQSSFGQQPSVFGATPAQPAAPANPFSSAFGQTTAQPASGGSIFGKPAATPAFGGSAFGAQPSIFGQSQGQSSVFGAQPTAQPQGSIFGATAAQPQSSIFGATAQQPVQPQPSVFGAQQPSQPQASVFGAQQSAFGAQTAFGQPVAPQPAAAGNIFTQQPAQPQPAFASTPFGAQPPANAFAQQPSVFGQQAVQPQPSQPSAFGQPQQSAFFSQQTQAVNPSPFGMQTVQPQTIQSQPQMNPFTQQPQNAMALNGTEYSRMEDLSPEDLAAFKADRFEEGKLPTVPPPKELCVEWNF